MSFLADPASQSVGKAKCNEAALRIWSLVDLYKQAHTLRRAPYLISYATYSAIVVILNQTQNDASNYVNCIKFFWSALLDLQRGCNSGLGKPLKILKTLMHRLGQPIPTDDPQNHHQESLFQRNHHATNDDGTRNYFEGTGSNEATSYDYASGLEAGNHEDMSQVDDQTWVDTMMYGQGLIDDSLFGLFAADRPFTQGFD